MSTINRPIAADIPTFEQLNRFTQLNGVPIGVIEARARPGRWSSGGFIGPSERFLDVLENDWDTVASLGLTHVEIAEHLNKIIRTACRGYGGLGYADEEKEISYDFSQVPNARLPSLIAEVKKTKSIYARFCNTISDRIETVKKASGVYDKMKAFIESFAIVVQRTLNPAPISSRIHVHVIGYGGHQADIFKTGDELSRDGAVLNEYEWCRDYTFTNRDTGAKITVAYGVIEYIKRFGFYEGAVAYRVDPIQLLHVLTGADVSDLEAYARSKSSS